MKKKLIAAVLCGVLIAGLAGCGDTAEKKENPDSTVTVYVTSDNDKSDDIPSEPAAPTEHEHPADSTSATQTPTEKEKNQSEPTSPPDVQPEIPKLSETPPVQTNPPKKDKPALTESVQPPKTEKPKPTKPPVTETPKPEPPKPTESPQETENPTEPPAPEFDINHWISYAKSYAERIGLELDSEAVECWDNPIAADTDCIYIQRDIESRLNRYNRDEGITAVWIWAEKRADGDYDLYIGYA